MIAETKGLVLFSRDYKEKDKLVKLFTESAGKQMFYVRGAHKKNNSVAPAIQNYTEAIYLTTMKSEGLSFINGVKEVTPFRQIQADIFLAGYASYLLSLVDAAIEDRTYDPQLFHFTETALKMLDQAKDPEIITGIFEIQLLQRFGVAPIWDHCVICGQTQGKFDYSFRYNGVLCEKHWFQDEHRLHADPRAIHFLRLFASVSYEQIQSIKVKPETKKAIRKVIDELYEEYVGIHLKAKKFIDQMHDWQQLLE